MLSWSSTCILCFSGSNIPVNHLNIPVNHFSENCRDIIFNCCSECYIFVINLSCQMILDAKIHTEQFEILFLYESYCIFLLLGVLNTFICTIIHSCAIFVRTCAKNVFEWYFFCRFSSEFSVFISVLIKHYQILYSERAINTFAINKEIKSYKNFEVFGSSLCSNSKKWNYCVLTTPW